MATLLMLTTQVLGVFLLLIVFLILYNKIRPFSTPLEVTDNPRRELMEVATLFTITFSLSMVYWLWGLPALSLNPVISFSLKFFVSLLVLAFVELVLHRRKPEDLGLVGYATQGRSTAAFLIGFGVLWGVLKLIVGYPTSHQSIGVLLYYVLIPAFIEEWEFRAIYQTKIERSLGQDKAWLIGGILFGCMHIPTDFFGYFWEEKSLADVWLRVCIRSIPLSSHNFLVATNFGTFLSWFCNGDVHSSGERVNSGTVSKEMW